jgi:hypothetical protein
MVPPSADDAAINQIVETTRESPEACRQAFFECNKNVEEAIFFLVTSAPHCLETLTWRHRAGTLAAHAASPPTDPFSPVKGKKLKKKDVRLAAQLSCASGGRLRRRTLTGVLHRRRRRSRR